MFTHRVQMQIKADSFTLLSRKIENTILPMLHPRKGFRNAVTAMTPERSTATEDTHWETLDDAEAYQQTGYPKVLKELSAFVIAKPVTFIFEGRAPMFSGFSGECVNIVLATDGRETK